MRLSKEQQYGYNRFLDSLHLKASEAYTLKAEKEYLIKQAKQKAETQIAKNLIKLGLDDTLIMQATGLSLEQIQALRS